LFDGFQHGAAAQGVQPAAAAQLLEAGDVPGGEPGVDAAGGQFPGVVLRGADRFDAGEAEAPRQRFAGAAQQHADAQVPGRFGRG